MPVKQVAYLSAYSVKRIVLFHAYVQLSKVGFNALADDLPVSPGTAM